MECCVVRRTTRKKRNIVYDISYSKYKEQINCYAAVCENFQHGCICIPMMTFATNILYKIVP
jgi:hypothetical protein